MFYVSKFFVVINLHTLRNLHRHLLYYQIRNIYGGHVSVNNGR